MKALDFRPARRRRPSLNVTSLIDVLFLLLIFIMVSSTFAEQPAIELELPAASAAESAPREQLTLVLARDGALWLDGERVSLAELRERLATAAAADPALALDLEGDRAVPYGSVIAAVDAARAAGVRRISAFTAPPEGEAPP